VSNLGGARELFATAKRGYAFRSKIVHGQWKQDPTGIDRMAEAENLVRVSLNRILGERNLVALFSGKGREEYLDQLAFRGGAA